MRRIGFLINPAAGIGGRVGLKGSDGEEIKQQALALGAKPEAQNRAAETLKYVESQGCNIQFLAAPGIMGAAVFRNTSLAYEVVGALECEETTARDTVNIVREMENLQVELIVFAGGDGTARDVCEAVCTRIPVLGIPAGVKIHSAVYAYSPRNAGEAISVFCSQALDRFEEAEVMDIDEAAFRQGTVRAKLYGYMKIPLLHRYMQSVKSGGYSEKENTLGIAAEVVSQMEQDIYYVIGPGTTTRAVMDSLELPNTLLGMDIVKDKKLIKSDANEQDIYALAANQPVAYILTVIGGQGHLFGRGNQQISPRVLRKVVKEKCMIIATKSKLFSIPSGKLTADTGDAMLDKELSGYERIITGYKDSLMFSID